MGSRLLSRHHGSGLAHNCKEKLYKASAQHGDELLDYRLEDFSLRLVCIDSTYTMTLCCQEADGFFVLLPDTYLRIGGFIELSLCAIESESFLSDLWVKIQKEAYVRCDGGGIYLINPLQDRKSVV